MIYENDDDLGYFMFNRELNPPDPWDPDPLYPVSDIEGVDCDSQVQANIAEAAYRMHNGAIVAAEWSRRRAGYGHLFDAQGNIT